MVRKKEPLIDWSLPETESAMTMFLAMAADPPTGSVRVKIGPAMARWILATCNRENRPLRRKHIATLAEDMRACRFVETGDTIKIGVDGVLLDGQHRLQACVTALTPIVVHVAFGITSEAMAVIDIGAKRSGGDILSLLGVGNAIMMAGAIRIARYIEESRVSIRISNAEIADLASGRMAGIAKWLPLGRKMHRGKGLQPATAAGFAFKIAETDEAAAEAFFEAWMHGMREGRNTGFNVLETRLTNAKAQNLSKRDATLGALILTFNAWHHGRAVSRQELAWRAGWPLPPLFAEEFRKPKDEIKQTWAATELSTLRHMKEIEHASWPAIAATLGRSKQACRLRYAEMMQNVEIDSVAPARPWPI